MEKYIRTLSLLGEDNFKKIQNLKVAIIGVGGVGGYAVETLARLGVKKLDFSISRKDFYIKTVKLGW